MRFLSPFPFVVTVVVLLVTIFCETSTDIHKYWGAAADLVCSSRLSSPYTPSWGTWFHPQRLDRTGTTRTKAGQSTNPRLLYQLGGNGPWIQRITPRSPSNTPPESCKVEQVHMISRHAERYPTKSAGSRHLALVERLKNLGIPLNGSLSFVNEWHYFTDNPELDFEQLTSTGPYAGTLGSFTTGVRFRTRYGHLFPKTGQVTRFWASDSKRVIDTAKYFAAGIFGINWEEDGKAQLEVIPETFDRHTDTLTPGDTCASYIEDTALGHDYGRNMLEKFQNAYIPPIADRLLIEEGNREVGSFSNLEIYSMQEMCGFETIARGSSPWCNVFTIKDWDHFEYARDLIHFYRAGPGNKYAGAMGWLWLNATAKLLEAGPELGTTFFSFVHDGDIAPVLTALDLFPDPKYGAHLPVTHIAQDRAWRTSTVMPMGGRLTFERLQCNGTTTGSSYQGDFVRININDDVIRLSDCHSGPGESCPIDQFVDRVRRRRTQVGEFADICGTDSEATGISFLRQPVSAWNVH